MLYEPTVIYIDETLRTVVAVCFPGLQRVPENFAKMTKRPIFHIPNSKRVRLTFVAIRNQQMLIPEFRKTFSAALMCSLATAKASSSVMPKCL